MLKEISFDNELFSVCVCVCVCYENKKKILAVTHSTGLKGDARGLDGEGMR
jgi:hypothetical protein